MTKVDRRIKNPLKRWIKLSREEERLAPERYLSYYLDRVTCDDDHAWMTQNTYEEMIRNCGQYDGTMPTGQFCGKIFMRRMLGVQHLVWFGIARKDPMNNVQFNTRQILIRPNGNGPASPVM